MFIKPSKSTVIRHKPNVIQQKKRGEDGTVIIRVVKGPPKNKN